MASGWKFRFESNLYLDWLFRDDFLGWGDNVTGTNLSRPGPGAVYSNAQGSGSIKKWYYAGLKTATADHWLWSGAIGREVGRVLLFKDVRWTYDNLDFWFGLVPAVSSTENIYLDNSDTSPARNNSIFAIGGDDLGQASLIEWRQVFDIYWWPYMVQQCAIDQDASSLNGDGYTFAVILLDVGHVVYILDGSGEWRFFTHNRSSTARYMHFSAFHGSSELWFRSWRAIDSPGTDDLNSLDGWVKDYALGHQESIPVALTSSADLAFSLNVSTLPSAAEAVEVRFRIQDSSNYVRLTIDSTGDIDIDRVVAGSPTNIGTHTNFSGGRVMVICNGSRVRLFTGVTGERQVLTVTEATFQAETGVTLQTIGTSDIHDLMVFDYAPSGPSLAWLRKITHDRPTLLDSDASPTAPDSFTAAANFWARFRVTSLPSLNSVIIRFRWKDSDDYLELEITDIGEVYFRKNVGGSVSVLTSSSSGAIAVGDIVDLFAYTSYLYCYANETQVITTSLIDHIDEVGFWYIDGGGEIGELEIYPFLP